MNLPFNNTYANLPEAFFARQLPVPVAQPSIVAFNTALADEIGLGGADLNSAEGAEILSGNTLPETASPISMAYGGHQFGNWVPQLGDGRAVLLGEVLGADGVRRDVQLKGAGRTPFSRGGDGRAALGPVLREYVVSEAMAALGVPTTRALAAVTSGETVMREGPETGAILTRIAQSHVRVGTFQYFFARSDFDSLRRLSDYVIARHYPDVRDQENPYLGLLNAVIVRQARLIAKWMSIGFVHGVMNTDNMSVAGETIDYGPCAFLDEFRPFTAFSFIDRQNRYAWKNQATIGHWNLSRLAQSLVPLLDADDETAQTLAQTSVDGYSEEFSKAYFDVFLQKIGLTDKRPQNRVIIGTLLTLMDKNNADFTNTFVDLERLLLDDTSTDFLAHFEDKTGAQEWITRWQKSVNARGADRDAQLKLMAQVNPRFIPRNHRVEAVIVAANQGDYSVFEKLNAVLANPYTDQPENADFSLPPQKEEIVPFTYCGT